MKETRVKHTEGTMSRTDDGFDPLEVAGGEKKFARPKVGSYGSSWW